MQLVQVDDSGAHSRAHVFFCVLLCWWCSRPLWGDLNRSARSASQLLGLPHNSNKQQQQSPTEFAAGFCVERVLAACLTVVSLRERANGERHAVCWKTQCNNKEKLSLACVRVCSLARSLSAHALKTQRKRQQRLLKQQQQRHKACKMAKVVTSPLTTPP